MTNGIDIGIIGLGKMGRNHLRVYSEMKSIDKIYIYDINKEVRVKNLLNEYPLILSESVESMLKKVDAVSICTPTSTHFKLINEANNSNVNWLVEKPIASSFKESQEILRTNNDGLVTGVGHIERFNPVVKEIKNLIKNPKYIEIKRYNPTSTRIKDTDVVSDLMIHDIDIIWNYLINESNYDLKSFFNNDICITTAKFDECIASLSASRIACKKVRTIYVDDEDFSIEGDFMNQEIYIYRRPQKYAVNDSRYVQENIIEKVLVNKVEPLREELKTFVNCVKEGTKFPVTIEQAVSNLRIVEQIKGGEI